MSITSPRSIRDLIRAVMDAEEGNRLRSPVVACRARCGSKAHEFDLIARDGLCEKCWERRQVHGRLLRVVPIRFRWANFCTPLLAERCGFSIIHDALASVGDPHVIILGSPGYGKTSLVVAMLIELAVGATDPSGVAVERARVQSVEFQTAWELGRAQLSYPLGQGHAPEVSRARNASLLILDDIGTEASTQRQILREIIHHRHQKCRATWVTSSLSAAQLMQEYGDAVARRLFEHATVLQWHDHHGQPGRER